MQVVRKKVVQYRSFGSGREDTSVMKIAFGRYNFQTENDHVTGCRRSLPQARCWLVSSMYIIGILATGRLLIRRDYYEQMLINCSVIVL